MIFRSNVMTRLLPVAALILCASFTARADEEKLRAGLDACQGGNYRESVTLLEAAMQSFQGTEGESGTNSLKAMTCLARSYNAMGRHREALDLARKVVAARTGTLGEAHPDTLAAAGNAVEALRGLGQLREALALAQRTHEAAVRQLGERHGATLIAANSLSVALSEAGRLADAVALLETTVPAAAQVLGSNSGTALTMQGNLGRLYGRTGRLPQQLALHEQVLRQRRELQGDGHPDTWTAADNLAVVYMDMGRLDEALALLQRNVAQRKERLGESHVLTLTSMRNLASAQARAGHYAAALALADASLKASVRVHGAEHPLTLATMTLLAGLYGQAGNLAVQRSMLDVALRGQASVLGPNHPVTLDTMQQQLATLTLAGHAEQRLQLAQQLQERRSAVHGPSSAQAFEATRAVAAAEFELGRRAAAQRRLLQLTDVEARTYPAAPLLRVATLQQLALVHGGVAQADEYLAWAERAAEMARSGYGADHPATLRTEGLRASALHVKRRHEDALALRRSVLARQEKALGPLHPDVMNSLRGVFTELMMLRRFDEATEMAPRLLQLGERLRTAPALPREDRQRVSAELAAAYRSSAMLRGRARELPAALLLIEAMKSRTLLDALASRRAGLADMLPAADRDRLSAHEAQLAVLERKLAEQLPAETVALLEPARNAAATRLAELQRDLKSRFPRYGQQSEARPLTLDRLKGVLDEDSVFVHFVKSGHGQEYFALVIDPSGPWVWAPLGEQPDLADAVEILRLSHADPAGLRALRNRGQAAWRDGEGRYRLLAAEAPAPQGATAVSDTEALAADLGRRLLGPLEPYLSPRKAWILSPDGALARLPFDTLRLGGQRVLDRAHVHLAPSLSVYAQARELQRAVRQRTGPQTLLAIGDPAYVGADDAPALRARATLRQDMSLSDMAQLWEPLPGTRREVEALARLFPERAEVYLGERASKQQLQALQAQGRLKGFRYVHVAAHGFASDTAPALSGVVLSQRNLPAGTDGYVTAAEWPAFELGSELTVLSACDTALGPAVAGEGVLGLPYALFVAGSAATVLSLWPVDDAATALLMEEFYRRLVAGAAPALALADAKRVLKANPRYAAPRFWAPFVLVGAG